MPLQTRGSTILDKAERRLANLKSIDKHLDLGHGLTTFAYAQLIETTRAALDAHNTLLSDVEESRRNLNNLEKTLSDLSSRMLMGVATRYGKTSIQYSQAGGSVPKGRRSTAAGVTNQPANHPPSANVVPDKIAMTNGHAV